jgi:hypothetical protein
VALDVAGGLVDSPAGRDRYAAYLDWQAQEGPAGKSKAYANMSQGWALGGAGFRQALVQDHALVARSRAWESTGASEIRELQWSEALTALMADAGLHQTQLPGLPKSAPQKLAVAAFMKARTQAPNHWLCQKLHLGHPRALSHNLTRYRAELRATDPLWQKLTSQYST